MGTGSNFYGPYHVAVHGGYAYVTNVNFPPTVTYCVINSVDGITTSVSGYDVRAVAVGNGYAYAGGSYFDFFHFTTTSHVYLCAVSGQAVSNCVVSDGGSTPNRPTDIVIR